jgi:hypothetical protein
LSAEPVKFFTEPHYEGFPAVLVRLDAVTVADLKVLIADGWRCMAPADLADSKKAKPKKAKPKRLSPRKRSR